MEGKTLKNFILATGIWAIANMIFIAYVSSMISNIWSLILALSGVVILWLIVSSFIIVHFLKRNRR